MLIDILMDLEEAIWDINYVLHVVISPRSFTTGLLEEGRIAIMRVKCLTLEDGADDWTLEKRC